MDVKKILLTIVSFVSLSANAMMPDFFSEASSPNPNRGATSLAPNEIIDTFSGGLSIVHTDLVVPGNGGLDIKIQRTFSSNHIYLRPDNQPNRFNSLVRSSPYGLGWSMHFGRIRTNLLDPVFACPNTSVVEPTTLNNPVMETSDGGQRQLFCNTSPSTFSTNAAFISKDNWVFNVLRNSQGRMAGYQAIDPQGMKYTMDFLIEGGRAPLGDKERVWYTSKIEDRNGNRIDITYDQNSDLESPMFKTISSPDGRRVDFRYNNISVPERATLRSITYKSRVVNYFFDSFTPDYTPPNNQRYKHLKRVTIPGGASTGEWRYTYHSKPVGQPGDNNLKTITYPRGATVSYDYGYVCILFNNCSSGATGQHVSLVVKSKMNRGRDIVRGDWVFDYSVSADEAFNIVKISGPNSKEMYKHHKPPVKVSNGFPSRGVLNLWRAGLLDTKTISDLQNRVIQIETYTYGRRQLSSEPYERYPYTAENVFNRDPVTYQHYLTEKKLRRDGTDYITRYENFADNINPHRVVEIGQATKTTNLTYYPRRNGQNIVGQVASESVGSGVNRRITRTFDTNGNKKTETRFGVITKYNYDAAGNISRVEDSRGNATTFSNFKLGVPRSESRPEGVNLTRVVDDFANVTSVKDGRGNTTNYQYDDVDRLTLIDPPRGASTSISRLTSRRTVTRGAYSQVTNLDGFGRKTCTQTEGIYVGNSYDAIGNRIRETYPSYSNCNSSARTDFTYDALNRSLKTTHADNSSRTISYLSGNRQSVKDERANTFVSTYRSFGDPNKKELMSVSGPEALSYNLQRNIVGQVTRATRDGISRTYNYGASIFLQDETHPETGKTVFGRDALGNMTSRKVGNSGTTIYTYDRLNRQRIINYPGTTPDVVRTYDKNSNVDRITSGISDLTYRYDQNNNLETETHTIDGKTYNINYSYDSLDFMASTTNPDNSVITYAPNALGWPTRAAPYVTNVSYHASGQPERISYANGRSTTHTYQNRLWPHITTVDGGVSRRTRSYDVAGNLKSLTDNLRSNLSRTMTYDKLNRLKSANGPWGASVIDYTLADDISRKRMGVSDLRYTYNSATRRISSVSGMQDISGAATFDYDAYGNISRKSNGSTGWRYTYDDASNLRVVRDTSNNVLRRYDYSGLRQRVKSVKPDEIRLHVVNQQGQIINEFVTSGDKPSITNVYLGVRLVAELELSGNGSLGSVTGPGFGGGNTGSTVTRRFALDRLIESLQYCVDGYGISASNEVLVQINGTNIGYLRTGGGGTTTCFDVPTAILRIGQNSVVFSQQGGDNVWGIGATVENIKDFFNPASVVPAIMLLLDDEVTQ